MLSQLTIRPPGVDIKQLSQTLEDVYHANGTLTALGGERDSNFRLDDHRGRHHRLLVKVSNTSERTITLELQSAALDHLRRYAPDVPVSQQLYTVDGDPWTTIALNNGDESSMRVFQFLDGDSPDTRSLDAGLLREIGRYAALLDIGLRGFSHPGALEPVAWDLQRFDQLASVLDHVTDKRERELITRVFARFDTHVKSRLPRCRAQVIHNDISFHNIALLPGPPRTFSGFFDFGDMTFAPLVQEIAVAAAEFPVGTSDPLAQSAALVARLPRGQPARGAGIFLYCPT